MWTGISIAVFVGISLTGQERILSWFGLGNYWLSTVQPGQLHRVVLDLHSTTATMGNCLVVYGRRPADLALAALVQSELRASLFICTKRMPLRPVFWWSSGPVVWLSVGPVPGGSRCSCCDPDALGPGGLFPGHCTGFGGAGPRSELLVGPSSSLQSDPPRDAQGQLTALLHPARQGRTGTRWMEQPRCSWGRMPRRRETLQRDDAVVPVFVNEAAYAEKTHRFVSDATWEVWSVKPQWTRALHELIKS